MVSHDAAGTEYAALPPRQSGSLKAAGYQVTTPPFDTPQFLFLRLS
jgi:hypothetical protein